jgi:rhamnulokinase
VAGPAEATALGNILVQAIAAGALPDLATGRRAVAASVDTRQYDPQPADTDRWDDAFARFQSLYTPGDRP